MAAGWRAMDTRETGKMSKNSRLTLLAMGMMLLVRHAVAAEPAASLTVDILIKGGKVLDGAGNPWVQRDVGITGSRITFIGNADVEHLTGREVIDATGLLVAPGFIDLHSHATLDDAAGRRMLPQLYQGITTVVIGVDGMGTNTIAKDFAVYRTEGIGANVLAYVGFNAARSEVMGMSDQPAAAAQIRAMQQYVDRGMQEGAFGMSSGLFYVPATWASTQEVTEVAKASGRYHGIYDTHDRDLGAAYHGIGYLASTAEAIEIGEKSGNRVIFSHFSPQGRHNYGRAAEGAKLIDDARARGVDVMAAQHSYTATSSGLFHYLLPAWSMAGSREEMLRRFDDPKLRRKIEQESGEMLEIRGGATKIVFADPDPEVNGLTLQQVADKWHVSATDAVIRIARQREASLVMNIDLYDQNNINYLAQKEWMMTCTDGDSMPAGDRVVHPRTFGSFTKKLREMALDGHTISLPFAVRGMTGLAAEFLGLRARGLIKEGFYADLVVIDPARLRDRATYQQARYAEGMIAVLINGKLAMRDGKPTQVLAGAPIVRGER
jgi:N-acyl-D-amino-acid deacylase